VDISSVGVCGAGLMGSGIAQAVAASGYRVLLKDVDRAAVQRSLERLRSRLNERVERGRMNAEECAAVLTRIDAADAVEDLADCDLVIEAVFEDVGVKRELFAQLDRACKPQTLLATNTSTLSPTEIGATTQRADRTAGLHFFNPAPVMKLVEVIPGMATASQTTEALKEFVTSLGKTPVVVQDSAGGIVSRLLITVRNEAARMVMEGVATPEDIDTAMTLGGGWPMGPLALIDLVGVDLHVTNADSLANELGERFRPPPILRKMVRAGYYGQKNGRGFYTHARA
jgi:3-hydroxybutyryl-CoA dehydrogenase